MNDCKLQLQQFVTEWELMVRPSSVVVTELEIGDKSPEVLFQEIIHHIESECKMYIHPSILRGWVPSGSLSLLLLLLSYIFKRLKQRIN